MNLLRLVTGFVPFIAGSAELLAQQPGDSAAPSRASPEPSRLKVDFSGTALLNAFYTSDKTNNSDLPQFVAPLSPTDTLPQAGGGATIRQSRVRLSAFAPEIAGGEFRGELDVDFFGGQQPSTGGRTFPLLRIRRVFGELAWGGVSLFVGQEAPPIAELNPSTLASLGLPGFSGSGNLWLWIPQARLTGHLSRAGTLRLSAEAAVLAPTGYQQQDLFLTQFDLAERSRRPYLQARAFARWGENETAGELSLGGHYGWLATGGDTLLDSKAVAFSARLPLTRTIEIQGEAFAGQAIAGLGGGGIGQNLGAGGVPVRTRGGWAQVNLRPALGWEVGGGFGMDDPKDADLDTGTQRLKNETWEAHVQWRPSPFVLGFEYRRIETTYGATIGKLGADHVNLASGFEF